jgi:hypothetical protein
MSLAHNGIGDRLAGERARGREGALRAFRSFQPKETLVALVHGLEIVEAHLGVVVQHEIDAIAQPLGSRYLVLTRRHYEAQNHADASYWTGSGRFRAADRDKQNAVLTLLPVVQDIERRAG